MLNRVLILLLLTFSVRTLQDPIEELNDDPLCGEVEWSMTCTGCNSMTLCMPSGTLDMFCIDDTPYCIDGADGFATCSERPTAECEPTTVKTTTEPETTTSEWTESTTEDTTTSLETTESTTPTTSTEPPTPPKPVSSMKCTGPGLFPDPRDCNAYHYCFAKGDQSHALRCSEGFFFDYASQSCEELSSPSQCLTIQCDPLKVFQQYDTAGQYYGVCSLGTIAVYRCPAAIGDTGLCPFACSEEGFFANTLDSNTYFHCWRMYGAQSLSMRMLYCPAWWEFEEKTQRCVFKGDL